MDKEIYVIQGLSGLVFLATNNYQDVKAFLLTTKIDVKISHWINCKHIFTETNS